MAAVGSRYVARRRARRENLTIAKAGKRLRAVAYLRVSTDEQAASGNGLEAQDRGVRAFCESQDYEVVDVITDAGISGATDPALRPGFARVLELAEARAFDVLIVHKIDRLARNISFAVSTVSALTERHEVAFRSVTESVIDTSNPMGRTFFAIFAGMAENERYVIRDRTAGGRTIKADKGGFAGGRVPYGYRRDPETKQLVVHQDEAQVVKRIFREVKRERRTLQAVAAGLNADQIPSPAGKRWHPQRIAWICENPKYRGHLEYLFTWTGQQRHVLRENTHQPILRG